MTAKLFVGSLAYSVDNQQLGDMFGQAGKVVSSNVILNRETNQSKGFGFVEMETDKEAHAAIKMLNGKEVSGRQLTVNMAKPKERSSRPNHRY